jgi:hypothetical protein
LGEVEQVTVAGRIRAHRRLGEQAAHHVDSGGSEGVAVGSTPITPSVAPASLVIAMAPLCRCLVVSAWRTPRGASVTGHNPRVGQAAHQASKTVGQVDAGTTADNSSPRQPTGA